MQIELYGGRVVKRDGKSGGKAETTKSTPRKIIGGLFGGKSKSVAESPAAPSAKRAVFSGFQLVCYAGIIVDLRSPLSIY